MAGSDVIVRDKRIQKKEAVSWVDDKIAEGDMTTIESNADGSGFFIYLDSGYEVFVAKHIIDDIVARIKLTEKK